MEKFKNLGIVGIGLIGGSIAADVKKKGIAGYVTGFSRRLSTLKKAKDKGLIDEYFTDFTAGVKELDFLVICTPVGIVEEYMRKIRAYNSRLLFTDTASVKGEIVRRALEIFGEKGNFVGSHPIAGSEKNGIDAAQENLFKGKEVIITPLPFSSSESVEKVKSFWRALGSKMIIMDAEEHDRIMALTSHFPHLLVYAFLSLFGQESGKETGRFTGSGFTDTTRIGKSNGKLWSEILLSNRENLFVLLSRFRNCLDEFEGILKGYDKKKLIVKLENCRKIKGKIDDQKGNI
jgi:prephenate dehydrogenase